jgi:hypothetical protein
MNWIVETSPYNECSGGSIAQHKLCHMLCEAGESGYLTTHEKRPGWRGGYADPLDIQLMEGVMILPEASSNKVYTGLMPVIRWILFTPGVFCPQPAYSQDEMIYLYSEYYTLPSRFKVHGILGVYDFKKDFFVNEGRERSGTCYTMRKGMNKRPDQHPKDAIYFERSQQKSDAWLKETFNTCERFISYDDVTMLSLFAAMCGCESVVVPGELPADEWRRKIPYLRYGISYGTSMKEMAYAYDTLGEIPENIERLEKESEDQVQGMIEHVKEALC